MPKNGIDKLAFLVVLAAAALVVLAAAGTNPAWSDDSGSDPARIQRVSPANTSFTAPAPADAQAEPTAEEPPARTAPADDGYEWSGSRPADERYLWSHRPN